MSEPTVHQVNRPRPGLFLDREGYYYTVNIDEDDLDAFAGAFGPADGFYDELQKAKATIEADREWADAQPKVGLVIVLRRD